ncbi:MAG: hypothetical protein M1404_03210 [Acidobacteria bacterium]|nr:hypothetical protein [Acidobacteriota bacterium]
MRKAFSLALLLLAPAFAQAQSPITSWDNLKQLQPGQKTEVVDSHLRKLKGKFVSLTEDAISLQERKEQRSVARGEVMRVSVRDTSHRKRNMLLGAAIAGGAALTIGLLANAPARNEGTGCDGCVAGFAAAAAGGGAALGSITGFRTIYRANK